eukprot:8354-Pelagococcus_subviridis.AAC.1
MRDATPRPCNVWVFCPAAGGCAGGREPRGACWLKHQPRPENPTGPADAPDNPWTSGSMAAPADVRGERGVHKRFHVVVTTNANPYQAWQVRTMHYWYLKQKAKQDPRDGQMGGFTRVLHDQPDGLMDEIPTCVVDRLDDEMGFVVLSRPNAFKQFFEKCPEIEEDYILMAEPDHLYLRPLDNLMNGRTPAAFPFFYIEPAKFPTLVRRFMGDVTITDADLAAMDPIGSSPVFIHKDDLRKIAPTWHDVTVKIKRDPEANKEWGWVLEMYGYTIASWLSGVRHDLRPKLQAQPPWDKSVSDFYILHFTYGNDYDLDGTFTPGKMGKWRFDKRTWTQGAPENNLTRPPAGMDNELVRFLVDAVNEASASLPHWDDPTGMKRLGGKPAGQGLRRKDTASVSSGRPRAGGRRGGGGGAASASTPRTTTAATGDELTGQIIVPNAKRTKRPEIWHSPHARRQRVLFLLLLRGLVAKCSRTRDRHDAMLSPRRMNRGGVDDIAGDGSTSADLNDEAPLPERLAADARTRDVFNANILPRLDSGDLAVLAT